MPALRGSSVLVGLALVVAAIAAFGPRSCTWGTFSYSVPGPGGTENTDLAVRREGREVRITRDGLAARSTLSPDGRRVAFESGVGGSYSDTVGYSTLAVHVADVDGSDREALTAGPFDENPSWAPDGTKILFLRKGAIWTVDVGSKEERLVYRAAPAGAPDPSPIVDAEWSGDSSRIAFFVRSGSPDDGAELWVVDADGSHPHRVAALAQGDVEELAWSPTGQAFAWTAFDDGLQSLYMMPSALPVPRAIEPNAQTPVWSRDGERLAYVIGREGRYRSRVIVGDASGENTEQLPDSPEHVHDWASC